MSFKQSILLVGHSSASILGGAERSLVDIARSCVSLGCNVTVALPSEMNSAYIEEFQNIPVRVVITNHKWHIGKKQLDKSSIKRFVEMIDKFRIDIVFANTITLREPMIAAHQRNIPAVVMVREVLSEGILLTQVLKKDNSQIIRELREDADYIIANSVFTLNHYFENGRTAIVRNTFAGELLRIRRIPSRRLRIGFVGNFSVEKGSADFFKIAEAFLAVREVSFHIIGASQGETSESLKRRLPSNVEYLGYLSNTQEIYSRFDVLLQLSTLDETFSRVVLEALASAAPVIAYKSGAVSELIEDGVNGYLLEVGDIAGVVERIKSLKSAAARGRMSFKSRASVKTRFSAKRQQSDLAQVLTAIPKVFESRANAYNDLKIVIPDTNKSQWLNPFLVGNRARTATATGVRFLSDNQFVVASLVGQKLYLYEFNYAKGSYRRLSSIDTTNGRSLVSCDSFGTTSTRQIITANCEDSSVSIYSVSGKRLIFDRNISVAGKMQNFIHGAKVLPSPDTLIAACVTHGEKGILFYDLKTASRVGHFTRNNWGVKDMAVLENHPNHFVAVMTKQNVGQSLDVEHEIELCIVKAAPGFARFKVLDACSLKNESIETISTRGETIYLACQSSDSVLEYDISGLKLRRLREKSGFLLPHGVDVSPSGELLAVANYGSSSVSIRKL